VDLKALHAEFHRSVTVGSSSFAVLRPMYQAYVQAKLDEQDNSWFPIARAMCLQQSSDEMQERLQRIEDVLKAYVRSRIFSRAGLQSAT